MYYTVTFKLTNRIIDSVSFVERRFPQVLAGAPMSKQMMMELVLAEYPDANVSIDSIINSI
tara:strand:+ start:75 stop:257 length:183 start_codon:yes stop_codon:yes gene_type:complete